METKLKYKEMKYNIVDYFDLEQFIENVWKDRFNSTKSRLCIIGEQPNDSTLQFNNVKKGKLDKWDKEYLENFYSTSFIEGFKLKVVLSELCNEDLIPPGNYLIEVSW